ncbi:MAG: cobaltochelatase subunit CobN, partial [Pseudomonadota bacterium]
MHVIFRESHGLEETETPTDLGQSPSDLVFLSFSDSDLGAFAEAWHRGGGPNGDLPTLRLANLVALKHPLSVDTYIEQTLSASKGIIIRLIGGVPYWAYGLQQVLQLCKQKGIALAVLPADGRPDPRLDEYSTLPVSTLRRLSSLCDQGGAVAAQAALVQMAIATGLYAKPVPGFKGVPAYGDWTPDEGITTDRPIRSANGAQRILIVFYRSYLVAVDLAPIKALSDAFHRLGYEVTAVFASSLKAPDAAKWLRERVAVLAPAAIVNATSFSGNGDDGTSPLDVGGVPVFQVALATSTRQAWFDSDRGLSPADLAMHVVLPEVDGRIFAGLASHKEPGAQDPALEFSRFAHRPAADRVTAIATRVHGWLTLATKPVSKRRVALVLSTYPGKEWNIGHAVGLDAAASAQAILEDLGTAGYAVPRHLDQMEAALGKKQLSWSLARYKAVLAKLPPSLQADLTTAWGPPEADPDVRDDEIQFRAIRRGNSIIALQPERGAPENRGDDYHDLSRTPRHAYVAFYLWLQGQCDALVHIGAHGTLEWLPGKSAALSAECWPEVLTGSMPVLYPFIVNDPGEAAQAKRRLGAITLGHIPPAMKQGGTPERLVRLESLLDEFSNADGLDPKRRQRLQEDIRFEAQSLGVEDDLGLNSAGCAAEAITRIDRFVCDVKDSLFGDGLHIWGRPPKASAGFETDGSINAERQSLLDALDGKWIAPGPAGSPYRGRTDVLPTGRNIYSVDPRSVPTRSAYAQGVKLGEELVRHHLQTEGDWPKRLIVDLWGSATMRTAGEEFAMALSLLGVKPIWDQGTERVSGITVVPIAELDRPRIDVTLRISGLFRDVFPTLSALYSQAIRVLSQRDEAADWNPFVDRENILRVYGPAPGSYGLGMGAAVEDFSPAGVQTAGEAWLSASSWAHDGEYAQRDRAGLERLVQDADSFVHLQDLPETDLLLAADYAAHEAGFAAAQRVTGGHAALYHLDSTNPERPRSRHLSEEIAR